MKLFRRYLCLLSLALLPHVSHAAPPNILWITFEDSGAHLKPFGDPTAPTPNIDRLAARGRVFEHAYAVSGVCSPSRAAVITGMYPQAIGAHNHRSVTRTNSRIEPYVVVPPAEVKCVSEYLRQAGYYCTNNAKCDYNFGPAINQPPASAWDDSGSKAHWRNRPEGSPFFSVFNFNGTHMFQLSKRESEPLRIDPASVSVPPIYKDSPKVRGSLARYYDNLIRFDEWVGALLAQLEEDGLVDNTVIFLFSDHGWAMPRGKIWLYDAGIRVPLLVIDPRDMSGARRDQQLVSLVDLAPTVLSLADVPLPTHLQGRPFLGTTDGGTERAYVFAGKDRVDYHDDLIRAVRDRRFKYIRNYQPQRPYLLEFPWIYEIPLMQEMVRFHETGELNAAQSLIFRETRPVEELYDTLSDPWETRNLASDPAHADDLLRLRAALAEHQSQFPDLGFTPEPVLREQMWPNGIQPQAAPPQVRLGAAGDVIALSCATEGASILYQVLAEDAAVSHRWALYHKPFAIPPGSTVAALAVRYGFIDSAPTLVSIPKRER